MFGIMAALLIDIVGILMLLGGLVFGLIMFLIGKCKGSREAS